MFEEMKMLLTQQIRKIVTALVLILVLTTTAACSGTVQAKQPTNNPTVISPKYTQLERGNTATGENFGDWVVQTSKGLVEDAYVRDNNKLGVVVTPQVAPGEVQPLAKSLVQGFRHNFPNQDLTVLMYAPDKKLILTAKYDTQSQQVNYK
jgi:hypothetical protein